MLTLNLESMIREVYNLHRETISQPIHYENRVSVYRAITLTFDARWNYWAKINDEDATKFHRSSLFRVVLCGHTHTFFQEHVGHYGCKATQIEFVSSHNSCWISSLSQRISKLYFDMCREIECQIEDKMPDYYESVNNQIRPIDIDTNVWLRGALNDMVWAHVAPNPNDNYGGYRKILKNVDTDNRIIDSERIYF